SGRPCQVGQVALRTVRPAPSEEKSDSMNNNSLMFAPMAVRLAAQGERDRQEREEQFKAERERQEKARLEDERNSPKAVRAQFIERTQAIDARAQELHPPIDAQARAEEQ